MQKRTAVALLAFEKRRQPEATGTLLRGLRNGVHRKEACVKNGPRQLAQESKRAPTRVRPQPGPRAEKANIKTEKAVEYDKKRRNPGKGAPPNKRRSLNPVVCIQ